jgi:hypothetical protein
MKKLLAILIIVLMAMAACSPITKQAKQDLARPANCATAESDMKVLLSEKASVLKMIGEGVTAIIPVGAVISILDLSEVGKLEMATDDYNRKIDKKIKEIKSQCGL